jgi:hypothetical protein
VHGVQDESLVAPESYTLDSALLARPGNDEIQLDLFLDYASNVALYPTFQEYFRTHRPPLLAVWGKNDPFFLPAAPRRSSAIFRVPSSASSTRVTSRWKRMPRRSRRRSAASSRVESIPNTWSTAMRAIVLEKAGGLEVAYEG